MSNEAPDTPPRGDWFQTHTGRRFRPLDPRPSEVCLEDIAHALARVCRFNGHVRGHYSVAQHSVLVSHVAERLAKERGESNVRAIAYAGLLHDAAEAYVGDMVRPLKVSMPEFREVEHRVEELVAACFSARYPWPDIVKEADNIALATERRDCLAAEVPWESIAQMAVQVQPLAEAIKPMTPVEAELAFLERYQELASRFSPPLDPAHLIDVACDSSLDPDARRRATALVPPPAPTFSAVLKPTERSEPPPPRLVTLRWSCGLGIGPPRWQGTESFECPACPGEGEVVVEEDFLENGKPTGNHTQCTLCHQDLEEPDHYEVVPEEERRARVRAAAAR